MYPLPSMAVNLPCLTGSHVLTAFVWHIHNQGVSSAPLQGHAPRKIFLPTTGSFFVFLLTLLRQQHFSADVFLLLSASVCPSPGKFQLNLLITLYRGWNQRSRVSMKWHCVPLIADSNRDILPLRFCFAYAACNNWFCGLLMSFSIFFAS